MKLILILSVSLCSPWVAIAADAPSSIAGGVIDDSRNAVANVLVDVHSVRQFKRDRTGRLVAETPPFSTAVITDANGNFTVTGLPSGQYLACAYRIALGYLSNCEWNETVPVLTVGGGTQLTNLTLTVRKGAVISIVAADPAHLITPPSAPVAIPSGHYFFPSVKTAAGYFSVARLSANSAGQHTYSVTIPATATVEFFFDSDLSVIGANGQPIPRGVPSGLVVTDGAPATIRVSLSD